MNSRVWTQPVNERLFDYSGGIKTFFSSLPDGTWQFRHEFDSVRPELEASKELAKNDEHWDAGVKKEMVHYAHIPDAVLFKWHCEGIDIKDNKALLAMVNKREWAYLKNTTKHHE